jgi:hypothetical protein
MAAKALPLFAMTRHLRVHPLKRFDVDLVEQGIDG